MGKNNNHNHSNNNHNNHNAQKHNELDGIIRNDEQFDIEKYNVKKENHRARMTDEELRDSILNYKVPELQIPDFSHAKSVKINDNSEKQVLLDKLMMEEDKKSNKLDKYVSKKMNTINDDNEIKEIKVKKESDAMDKKVEDKKDVKVTGQVPNASTKKNEEVKIQNDNKKLNNQNENANVKQPVKQTVKQQRKQIKRLNVKALIRLIFICFCIGLIIGFIIVGGSKLFNNFGSIKKSNNIPDGVTISDYTPAPLTNYGIYKTMPEKVRGVYISEYTIASSSNVDKWINICKSSELNALVINVKNDDGLISFEVDYDLAHEIGADANRTIKDPNELTLKLKQNGIVPIARIVSFKDPYLAKNRSDLALKNASGNVLAVKSGSHYENWVNPYNRDLWKYVVEVSKCALDAGFKEVQYDYIRFGTGAEMDQASFGFDSDTKTKRDIILEFSQYAKDEIDAYGGYLAADVFGTIITSDYDAKIVGQNYLEMCKIYDFVCPMIYPSHYNNGSLGVTYPDLDPYNLVLKSLQASKELTDTIPEGQHKAIVRAWLQDFTATWVKPHQTYGPQQIREQKQAVYDSGNTQWLLWNAGNNYSLGGLD
ncbi:MAG: hypothetical protein MJ245_06470 [Clostridia bacterium]|nr:hypothetical protein [Clostridia bacterium]